MIEGANAILSINNLDVTILSVIQGITEFLPISSSGHLVILEDLLNLPVDKLKSFDVAVHVGTLLSIFVYFWKDIWVLIKGFFKAIFGKQTDEKLFNVSPIMFFWFLIVGTIPAVIVGLFGADSIDSFFRDSKNVGYSFLATGFFFIFSEYLAQAIKSRRLTTFRSVFIGIFQAIAIIPGVSRSGSTIGAGLISGLTRNEAAKFSFLLGMPALLGAGILTAYKESSSHLLDFHVYALGAFVSFVSGYISIYILMKFLKSHSLAWFSIYLLPLGIYLLLT